MSYRISVESAEVSRANFVPGRAGVELRATGSITVTNTTDERNMAFSWFTARPVLTLLYPATEMESRGWSVSTNQLGPDACNFELEGTRYCQGPSVLFEKAASSPLELTPDGSVSLDAELESTWGDGFAEANAERLVEAINADASPALVAVYWDSSLEKACIENSITSGGPLGLVTGDGRTALEWTEDTRRTDCADA